MVFDFNVNDVSSGIASCSLILNGAVDQNDVSITENTLQSFTKNGLANGSYSWDVNCTDDSVNSNRGSSDQNRAFTVAVPRVYASFTPTAGTDTTGASYSLVAADLTNVSTSNDVRYSSQTNWPKNNSGYNEARYVEFVFSPTVPSTAAVVDVNVDHEFSLSGSSSIVSKLEVWKQSASTWTDVALQIATIGTTDVVDNKNIFSIISTPGDSNSLKIRFLMYVVPNTNRTSRTDWVRVNIAYDP